MNASGIDNLAAPNPAPAVSPRTTVGAPEAERQQVRQLAQEFEALLMTQMLRDMRRSLVDSDEEGTGFGSDTNVAMILMADGSVEPLRTWTKAELATAICDRVLDTLIERGWSRP